MKYRSRKEFQTKSGKKFKKGDVITPYQYNLLSNSDQRNFDEVTEEELEKEKKTIAPAVSSISAPVPAEVTPEEVPVTISIEMKPATIAYHYNGNIVYKRQVFTFEIVSHEDEILVNWDDDAKFSSIGEVNKLEEEIITHFQKSI